MALSAATATLTNLARLAAGGWSAARRGAGAAAGGAIASCAGWAAAGAAAAGRGGVAELAEKMPGAAWATCFCSAVCSLPAPGAAL